MGKSLSAWIGGTILGALSLYSHAAGLGSLEVKSVLGEPLRAEVAISAAPSEVPSLEARLASPSAYQSAGLVYTGIVSRLTVTLNKAGDEPVLTITSTGPINEPVVDLLLELSWSSGRVSREYTAFIDPPFIVAEREKLRVQEATARAEPGDEGAETRAASLPDAPRPQPLPQEPVGETVTVTSPEAAIGEGVEAAAVAVMPEAVEETVLSPVETIGGSDPTMLEAFPDPSSLPADETMALEKTMAIDTGKPIGVIRGDTLSKIALANKPADVTLEQMLVVLFRNNPDAFSGDNMNRLRSGKIIRLGDPDEYREVNQAQALREVRVQYSDFKAYRERVAAAAMQQTVGEQPAQQTAAGAVTPKVEDGASEATQTASEVVKLSRGEPAVAGQTGAAPAEVRALEEKLLASEKALEDSNDRVARLEQIIEDLQKLAEVQSQDMAKLQSQSTTTAQPAATQKRGLAPAPPQQPSREVGSAPVTPGTQTTVQADQPAGGVPTTPPAAVTSEATAQAPPQIPATPSAQEPVRRAPAPAPSVLDQLIEKPYLLAVPLVVLLLIGLGLSRLRGRKTKARSEAYSPATTAAGTAAVASSSGTFAPADNEERLESTDAGGGEAVDPLEEADIFLAYGRDAQAEELLKEALSTEPMRFEIHAKLAEIYAKRSDKEAFENVAKQLYRGTRGEGEIWGRVARLGYSLDPDNPRYAEAHSDDADGEKTVVMRSEDMRSTTDRLDLELGHGEKTQASTAPDFDLSATDEVEAAPFIDPEATMEVPIDDDADTIKIDMAEAGLTATDLDLNAELPELDGEHGAEQARSETVAFDASGVASSAPGHGATQEDAGLDFDIEGISLDSDVGEQAVGESADDRSHETMLEMPTLDLSGIALDMDGATNTTQTASTGKDEKWYEVQTKFDLAKAYQEMGDKDGAKEILQEVITEGDSEQKAAAESVLALLD
jgi:pilus assembly protein FimV